MCEECEEYDDHGHGVQAVPTYSFVPWELPRIAAKMGAEVMIAIANGFVDLSNEFMAASNLSRANKEVRAQRREDAIARQEMADTLREMVNGKDDQS